MFRVGTPTCLDCGHHTSVVLAACSCSCHATGRPPSGRSHPTRPHITPPARGRVGSLLNSLGWACAGAMVATALTGQMDGASLIWFVFAVLAFAGAHLGGNR